MSVDVLHSDLKKSRNVSLSLHGTQLVVINTNLDISWVLSMFEKCPYLECVISLVSLLIVIMSVFL